MRVQRNENLPIEDHVGYVISKALKGHGQTPAAFAAEVGISVESLRGWRRGEVPPSELDALRRTAPALGLHPEKLVAWAQAPASPKVELPDGALMWNQPFAEDMAVNVYALPIPGTQEVLLVDTGVDPEAVLADLRAAGLRIRAVLLTHADRDHIAGLSAFQRAFPGLNACAHQAEKVPGAQVVEVGQALLFEGLSVTAVHTPGHTPGGLSYRIEGLGKPVCACGDALFCGSIGMVRGDYKTALKAIEHGLMQLPEATLLLPGHGPVTTVGHERAHNPFF